MLHILVRSGRSALAAAVCVVAVVLVSGATAAPSPRATLAGSTPSWATASNFKAATAGADAVGFRVYLGWRNAVQAEAAARAASDPASASYRQYLTPAQFRQQFAPTQASVNDVKSWLQNQGFSTVYTPSNNLYVSAEGTVAQAETAFGVQFGEYAVAGKTLRAPSADISVPSTLAGTVSAVVGLDQSAALVHTDRVGTDASPSSGFRNAQPCSTYWGEKLATTLPTYNKTVTPYAPCGYGPSQLQGAYGLGSVYASGITGAGQTVAVIDAYASPTITADVNTYSTKHGLPTFATNQFTQVVAPGTFRHPEKGNFQDPQGWYGEETLDVEAVHSMAPGANVVYVGAPNNFQDPQGWYGEETLDVEAVHSMAPGANVVYVGAPNNFQDLDAALNHVVDRHLAQIVTNSYGWSTELLPRGYVKPYNDILIQAAAEGIGVYFSSGDSGDEVDSIGYRTVDWPASSPWVTAVGGTSLGVSASNGYLFETGWGTARATLGSSAWNPPAWWYGGGGGTSRLFAEPSYQVGVADSFANYFKTGFYGRVVPDVSMVGDPTTGMLVGQTQQFSTGAPIYDEYRIGGTSLSSPLMAGVMALADQAAGAPHGFANPSLYALSGSAAFRDVTSPRTTLGAVRSDYVNGESGAVAYTLRLLNQTQSLTVANGYDDATGLGSPNGWSFVSSLGQ